MRIAFQQMLWSVLMMMALIEFPEKKRYSLALAGVQWFITHERIMFYRRMNILQACAKHTDGVQWELRRRLIDYFMLSAA